MMVINIGSRTGISISFSAMLRDPFGGGYCLPLGRLREPVDGVSRADHVLLTRSERCSAEWLDQVKSYFAQMHPGLPVDQSSTEIRGFRTLSGGDFSAENVGTCLAFSAIGEPDGFLHTLRSAGVTPRHEVRFPDHHPYHSRDLESLIQQADDHHCESLVCTAKDAVKVANYLSPSLWQQGSRFWRLSWIFLWRRFWTGFRGISSTGMREVPGAL